MTEQDALAAVNTVLEGMVKGVKDLKGSNGIPDTPTFDNYIALWARTFEEGLNSKDSAERKAEILKEMQFGIISVTMNCIADQCSESGQHILLARIYVMIDDLTKAVSKSLIDDLLGNDAFMRSVFGSGLN